MSSRSEESDRPAVIHDLGYRPYAGPRLTDAQVARSLYVTGLRHTFGLGRSGKSKILPLTLLGVMLLTAFILVAVLVQARKLLDLQDQIVAYSAFASTMNVVVTVFVAAQAPALVSRDLRFRTITLYLARPLTRTTYVLVRLASLVTAIWLFLTLPLVVLYVGGLLADLPVGDQTRQFLVAVAGTALLACVLAALSGLVSAWTTRRGLAVAAIIVLLLVSFLTASAVTGIAADVGNRPIEALGSLLSPYHLVAGVMVWAAGIAPPGPVGGTADPGAGLGLLRLGVLLVLVAGCVAGMLATYRRASRA